MWQFEPLNYASSPNPDRKDFRNIPGYTHRKKTAIIIVVSIVASIALFIGFFGGMIAWLSADSRERNRQLYQYYQNDENYLTVTGTLDEFYGDFTLIDTDSEIEPNKEFRVVSQSWDVLKSNGFHRDVTIGKSRLTVTFAKYDLFGDMPVVAISIGDIEYLEFETGKANLLKYLEDNYI